MGTTKSTSQRGMISPWVAVGLHDNAAKTISHNKVFYYIEKLTGYNQKTLQSTNRKRTLVDARKMFCLIMSKEAEKSSTAIGIYLRKDHSTVLHAIKTGMELLSYDKKFIKVYDELKELCLNPFSEYEKLCYIAR